MRVLVVGGDSTVGRVLSEAFLRRGDTVLASTRHSDRVDGSHPYIDLSSVEKTAVPSADVAFICAAVTGYATCRNDPVHAWKINVESTAWLARKLKLSGARTIYLSTNAVFDGRSPRTRADTAPAPISEYGRVKAAGEATVQSDAVVVRLTKAVPPNFPLLVKWHDALLCGKSIDAFSDMKLAPIDITYAVDALMAVADSSDEGIFQVSATHDTTYLNLAQELAHKLSAPATLVNEALASERGIPAEERPDWTSMDTTRLESLMLRHAPDPLDVLDFFLGSRLWLRNLYRKISCDGR